MLSILVYGRNDAHGYNLHKRVALSVNAIALTLTDPSDEIIFVDYNTPSDLPTFPEAIRDTFTDDALRRLRVIRVPTWVHQERFADLTRLVALEPIARNVGLRRANPANPWVLSTNTDMLFIPRHPDGSLTQAVADLDDGYYALPRFDIPEALWESMDRRDPATNIELVRDWGPNLHLDSVVLSYAYNGFDAPGDFQLVRRERLIEIDGFDEEMLHGWHVDSNLFKRLSLVYGNPGDLSAELSGYHCDHTRLATAVHATGGIQNDLHRFVEAVERPNLPDQSPAWGLADLELEEIDLRAGTAARFASALARVAPPALPTAPIVDGLDGAELMYSEAAHVLPYLVDPLTVLPTGSTIVYAGLNGELASMTAAFLRELGFTVPLQILDLEGAPRPEGTVTVPFEQLAKEADAVIFDFGFPRPPDGSEPPVAMGACGHASSGGSSAPCSSASTS